MDGWQFSAALLSAVLHAGWNAAVKASATPAQTMTAQMIACALLALPALAWTGLILWVWTRAPIALSAALRDTSALFGVVIAVLWLDEPLTGNRLLALALAVAGIAFLRLG